MFCRTIHQRFVAAGFLRKSAWAVGQDCLFWWQDRLRKAERMKRLTARRPLPVNNHLSRQQQKNRLPHFLDAAGFG